MERLIDILAMFLVPTHGGWEFAGMFYAGLSTLFTLILFFLVYALLWHIITNGILGRNTRRLAKAILRIQAVIIALTISLIMHILCADSFASKTSQQVSALTILCVIALIHEIIIRRVAVPTTKHEVEKKEQSLTQKLVSFLKSTWGEVKMIGIALKQDAHSKFLRITIAYVFNFLFCYIFLIPFAVVSMWLFSLNGVLALLPTSIILSILIDYHLKKKLASNQKSELTA